MHRLGWILALSASLSACAWMVHVRSMSYESIERIPKPSDHPVAFIADTTDIHQPYVTIGLVEGDLGNVGTLGRRELMTAMQREARKMGGDALVNLRRPLSLYSRAKEPDGRDLLDRERGPDNMPSYRWVAEVITFDILPETAIPER